MRQRSPTVSVILPTYNRLRLLQEAVGSVLRQEFTSWELIVVDDGSDDGTVRWVDELDDPRVRLLKHPHCANPAVLRNAGLEGAGGDYVAFLDSDDLWEPDKLGAQLEALSGDPESRWSYTASILIDADGRELDRERYKRWDAISGRIIERLLVHDAMVSLPTVMAERALLDEAGGFDGSLQYCEDYDLWLRLADRAAVLALSQPLSRIRIHPQSNTWGVPEVTAAFARVYERLGSAHPSRKVRMLCRKQRHYYSLYYARQLAGAGRVGSGWRVFFKASRLWLIRLENIRTLAKLLMLTLKRALPRG